VAEFLIKYQESGEEFDINDFGKDHKELLARLFFKDVIINDKFVYNDIRKKDKTGFSADPAALKF